MKANRPATARLPAANSFDHPGSTHGALTAPGGRPVAVVFSADNSVVDLIRDALEVAWLVESRAAPDQARESLVKPGVRIVVIDDRGIDGTTRGWLLDQAQRWAPRALVAYVAANHSAEVERHARSRNAQYYFSRPVDRERVIRVLRSFADAAR